jgi:hypothetical protein
MTAHDWTPWNLISKITLTMEDKRPLCARHNKPGKRPHYQTCSFCRRDRLRRRPLSPITGFALYLAARRPQ